MRGLLPLLIPITSIAAKMVAAVFNVTRINNSPAFAAGADNLQDPPVSQVNAAQLLSMPTATRNSLNAACIQRRDDMVNAPVDAAYSAIEGHQRLVGVGFRAAAAIASVATAHPSPPLVRGEASAPVLELITPVAHARQISASIVRFLYPNSAAISAHISSGVVSKAAASRAR